MSTDLSILDLGNLRGTDSNSLLRLYDRANENLRRPLPRAERVRTERAVERITKELRRRNVTQ